MLLLHAPQTTILIVTQSNAAADLYIQYLDEQLGIGKYIIVGIHIGYWINKVQCIPNNLHNRFWLKCDRFAVLAA